MTAAHIANTHSAMTFTRFSGFVALAMMDAATKMNAPKSQNFMSMPSLRTALSIPAQVMPAVRGLPQHQPATFAPENLAAFEGDALEAQAVAEDEAGYAANRTIKIIFYQNVPLIEVFSVGKYPCKHHTPARPLSELG